MAYCLLLLVCLFGLVTSTPFTLTVPDQNLIPQVPASNETSGFRAWPPLPATFYLSDGIAFKLEYVVTGIFPMGVGLQLVNALEDLSKRTERTGRSSDHVQFAEVHCGPSTLTLAPRTASQPVITRNQACKVFDLIAVLISRNGFAEMAATVTTGDGVQTGFLLVMNPSKDTKQRNK